MHIDFHVCIFLKSKKIARFSLGSPKLEISFRYTE